MYAEERQQAIADLVADRGRLSVSELADRFAVKFLPPEGGSVLLDAGTTTARLAAMLPVENDFTVFTNAVPIATRLAGRPNVDLHLLPGRVRTTTHAAVGEETVESLSRLRVDVAFVGTNGISPDHGLSTPDQSEAAAKRAMVRAAQRVVVVADSSKVGHESTVSFARLDDVDVLVTDGGIADDQRAALTAHGLEVVVS